MQQHDQSDVDTRAAYWATRLEEGDLTAAEREEFHAWLLEQPVHARTFVDSSLIPILAKALPRERPHIESKSQPFRGRPVFRFMAVAATAVLALVAGGLFFTDAWLEKTYETRTGEVLEVKFNEGSVAYLNTRTELRWLGEEDGDRRAELIKGEALFQIEHDERRPFVVVMETSEIHVLGTKFSVYRKTDNLTLVTVFEGTVEIRVSSNGSGSPAWVGRLSANQQMEYGPDGPSTAPQPRIANVAVLDQWRFGQLVLPDEGLPLPVVVSELSRYTDKRIVLGDPRLEELRVGGKFPTQDLRQALTRISRFVPMTFREQDDSFVLEYRTDDEQ